MKRVRSLVLAAALAVCAVAANAASVPTLTGPLDPGNQVQNFNTVIQSLNQNVPGFGSLYAGKNYLDNGDMFVAQRGTVDTTGGTTSGVTVAAYAADRWGIDTNVSSGAGHGQIVTSSPSPPPGFQKSLKMWRNSGALTQPVCAMQEIESARFTQLQGKSVIFSAFVQPLAGLTSASGAVTATLITGTGTDEGLGSLRSAVGMTASPAITPALTGVASASFSAGSGSPSWSLGTTAAWSRIYSAPVAVPATATEGAVAFCFTPVGSSSGSTDGFAFVGAMLEQSDPNQVAASAYEFVTPAQALARAQRFFWQISDPAATVNIPSSCNVTTANTTVKCGVWLPTQMQIAPVTAVSTSTSFGVWLTAGTAGTCTTLAASSASNTVNNIGVTCTTGGTIALGTGTNLIGAATAGTLNASADY